MLTITSLSSARARLINAWWPLCKAPIVGTNTVISVAPVLSWGTGRDDAEFTSMQAIAPKVLLLIHA